MSKIRVFEAFAGVGSQSMALRNIGVDYEVVGISEVDRYGLLCYDAIHHNNEKVEEVSKEEMLSEIQRANIGYNFSTGKSEIPKNIKDIKALYDAHIRSKNYGDICKIDVSKLPDFDLFTYSYPCFVAGTKVLTDKGFVNIEDVKLGDMVLTHKNRFRRVLDTMDCSADALYRLNTMCCDDILATEEHPFYVRKRYREWNNSKRMYDRKFSEPEWVNIKDLTKDYYVGLAINQNSKIPKWDGVTFKWSDGRKDRHSNILQSKMSSYEFWWLIGRYLGDGWLRTGGGIVICCAKSEVNDIKSKIEYLGFNYTLIEERTVLKFHLPFKEIGNYVSQFGRGAINKRLTNDIFDLPVPLLKGFLDGYFSADGHVDGKYQKACSISRELIYGIGHCVAKVYKRPFSVHLCKRPKKAVIEGRVINQNDTYMFSFKKEKGKQDKAFYEDGYIWCPINKLSKEPFDGKVYNIEVEEDNSYVVQNIIVHNCKNISVAGKQASLAKGSGTQSALLWECEKIIDAKLPTMLLMENVKNLVGPQHKPHFDEWCRLLELKGYNNYWHIYNASEYGLPQNRERVMMVSILKEYDKGFEIPAKRPLELRIKDILLDDSEVDNKYYLPLEISRKFKYKHKEIKDDTKPLRLGGVYDKEKRTHQAGSVWHQDCVSPTLNAMLGGYKQPLIVVGEEDSKVKNEGIAINGEGVYVTYNGVRVELPCACASRGRNPENPSDRTVGAKTEQRLELNVKGVTNTLTTVQKDNYILDERREVLSDEDSLLTKYYILRKLVPLECWRLMGYTDEDYYKCEAIGISNTKLYERSGRGIAVWMLEDIFKEMFNALKGIDVVYKEDVNEGYSEVAVTSL